MKILLIEDNETIVKALTYAFQNHGYQFWAVTSCSEARWFILEHQVDLIVLDIALPDGNGIDLYERTIKPAGFPTIFLTAEDDEEIIVKGLDLGGEDYITKPFSTKELMARVNRVLVRNKKESVIQIKDLAFDMDKMTVTKNDRLVELTSLERKLLHLLVLNRNKVVTRNTILDKIWEWTGNDVDDHTVTVYMKRIREKVGDEIVTTVRGFGYRVDQC
ncbi:MAG: response regulator transcription factor [Eubacterium sp.]|nr:response regulator transcription factor [Eubacterium sp.]